MGLGCHYEDFVNSIYRSNIDGEREEMVWLDGRSFASPEEQKRLDSVYGEEVIVANPYPAVMADMSDPMGALASFIAAFPDEYWETLGEDFIGFPENDSEDSVY